MYSETKNMFGHSRSIEYAHDHLVHLFGRVFGSSVNKSIHVNEKTMEYLMSDFRRAEIAFDTLTSGIVAFERQYGITPREDKAINQLQDQLFAWQQMTSTHTGAFRLMDVRVVVPAIKPSGELNLAGAESFGQQVDIAFDDKTYFKNQEFASMLRCVFPPEKQARSHVAFIKQEIARALTGGPD